MGKAIRYGIAVAIVVVFAFCTYIVNKTIITNGVNSIEENQAKEAMVQVQNYIRFIVGQMNQRMVDWACWDEAYAYMKVPKQSFLDNNFDEDFLTEQNISFAFFYTDNQALYNFIDTKNEKNVQTEEKLAVSSRLVQKLYASKDDLVSGLARIGPLFYVIAAHRIYDGKQSLPPNGALVMA
ncbi:MAG: hypothetical protein IJU76_15440, partial [Desulfovibrionaceae bacterium]|nr:hypothetical protein [Desulfovibrionaceae bacterium]